jgi:HEAT repeat protein
MTTDRTAVIALLADADPESRRRGTQMISGLLGDDVVELLLRALGDVDWRVRKEAAALAATIEPRQAVIDRLALALDDHENVGLRNGAVEALVAMGRDAVPAAVRALGTLDADGRKLAVEVLGGLPDVAGTRAIARALGDTDFNVRIAAAEALGSAALAGEDAENLAVKELTIALGSAEPFLQLASLNSLVRLDARLGWDVFEPLMRDPLLRRHAIAAAGRSHERAAVSALARAVGDRSTPIAKDALVALVECISDTALGEDLGQLARESLLASPVAASRVRELAGSLDDPRVRGAALVVLGLLRVRADIPELVRGLEDEEVADQAELGLRWFGRDAVDPLLEEGRNSSPPVRATTLALVPLLTDQADRSTRKALHEALGASTPDVLTAAISAISLTGGAEDLAVLVGYATSAEPRIAASASAALTSLALRHIIEARALIQTIAADGPSAVVGCILRGAIARHETAGVRATETEDITFLRGTLDHNDARTRRAAVDALAIIGGPTAAEVVARALADEEREVVLAAVRALGRMGQADPLLTLLDGVRDPAVIAAALRALGEASPAQAFDAARPLIRHEDPLLASSAVEAIGQLRGPRRDDALAIALDHKDPEVVKSALVELARDMSPRTLARLGVCLDHASYEVRRFAAELLGTVDDEGALALVRDRLDRETDPVVREALTFALGSRATRSES